MVKKCGRCKEHKDVSNFYGRGKIRTDWMSWCHACASVASKVRNRRLKLAAFEHYGGPKCTCCGETQDIFLALDHVDNDGAEQRKRVGSGVSFYSWLCRMNYPKDLNLQVLCHNCNIGKQINGVCPHKVSIGL